MNYSVFLFIYCYRFQVEKIQISNVYVNFVQNELDNFLTPYFDKRTTKSHFDGFVTIFYHKVSGVWNHFSREWSGRPFKRILSWIRGNVGGRYWTPTEDAGAYSKICDVGHRGVRTGPPRLLTVSGLILFLVTSVNYT